MSEATKEPIPLADLYAEYDAMRKDLMGLADMLDDDDDFKKTILDGDKRIRDLREGRDAQVLACHPTGEHWPPHPDCPACQKVAQMWNNQAKKRCQELGLEETEENLEIALKDFLKNR